MSPARATRGFDEEHLRSLLEPLAEHRALVGLDVDGTLVDHAGVMDPRVRSALHAVREAGHHVVIATGRSLNTTLPIVRLAGVSDGWSVSANGAVTTRITGASDAAYEIVETVTFDPEPALRAMYQAVPTARFAIERVSGGFIGTESFDDLDFGIQAAPASIEELFEAKDVVRVVVTAPDIPLDEFARIVERAGVSGCEYAVGWSSWLDMSAPGTTKASALESLRKRLGVDPEHTVTVGDGSNDVEMLDWAAVGVAMGQASDRVKSYADAETLDIDEHGAELVLQCLLTGGPDSRFLP